MVTSSTFGDVEDAPESRAWQKIRQGHLDSVSIGYRVTQHVDVEPGESAVVGSTTYTARDLKLRVSQKWHVYEVSLVGIGADPDAKIKAA